MKSTGSTGTGSYGIPLNWLTNTLVNGIATIATPGGYTFSSDTKIIVSRTDPNGSTALGYLSAATADRNFAAALFVVRSLSATNTAVTGDQSSFEYLLVG